MKKQELKEVYERLICSEYKTGWEYTEPVYMCSEHIKSDREIERNKLEIHFGSGWNYNQLNRGELWSSLYAGLGWVYDISASGADEIAVLEVNAYSEAEKKELSSFKKLYYNLSRYVAAVAEREYTTIGDGSLSKFKKEWNPFDAFEEAWGIYAKEAHKLGLCQGRHEIPGLDGYVFGEINDPTDTQGLYETAKNKIDSLQVEKLDLYVTGLTVALGSVVRACLSLGVPLTLYHFDKVKGDYYPQEILD